MSGFIAANSILLMTMGLNVMLGLGSYIPFKAGVYSFAGVGFLAIGAFFGNWFDRTYNLDLWTGVLICLGIGIFLSIPLGLMLMSLRRLYLSVATLAFSLLIQSLAYVGPFTGGVNGTVGITQLTSGRLLLIIIIASIVVLTWFERTPVARVMTAVAEDELGAAVAGINAPRVRFWSFVASGIFYSAFGAIWVHAQYFTSADYFGFTLSVQLLLYAAVGGLRSFWGTVISAAFITALPTIVGGNIGPDEPAIYGGLLLVTVVLLPGGLSSLPIIIARTFHRLRKTSPIRQRSSLIDEETIEELNAKSVGSTKPTISTTDLSRAFGGVKALHNVSVEIVPGEVLAIIGPNGAGKTTLINVITGMVLPTSGSVRSDDTDITGWRPNRLARYGIARTLQAPRIFNGLSFSENVELPRLNSRMWRWPQVRGNWSTRGKHLGFEVSQLPYGDRRLLEIERALTLDPFCLFLDEPSAGMIAEEVDLLGRIIRRQADLGRAVVVVEHNLRLVGAVADRVVVLASGEKIAEGTLDEVMSDQVVREAYLGKDDGPLAGSLPGSVA